MKKITQILLIVAIVCSIGLMLISCAQGKDPSASSDSVTLVKDNTPCVTIVYQKDGGTFMDEAVSALQTQLSSLCGAEIPTVSEGVHSYSDEPVEILIGSMKFGPSQDALGQLAENSYGISVSGNKVVIAANNASLYPMAAEQFLSSLTVQDGSVSFRAESSFRSESCEALPLAASGKTDYTIIYSADETYYEQAFRVEKAFRESGINIRMDADDKSASGKEIRIGHTNRPSASDTAIDYISAYIEKDADGNITITGNILYGIEIFANNVRALAAGGELVAMPEFMFGAFAPEGLNQAPAYSGSGTVEVFYSFEESNSYYLIIDGATEEDFSGYTTQLSAEGFTCYYKTAANGHPFETWTDSKTTVTVSHIAYTDPATYDYATESLGDVRYMSIAVDNAASSALPAQEESIEALTTEQLTMVGTGCGFVLRLADGRFLIFDGGMPEQAREIYDILQTQNVRDGEPIIAAWYLTHGHTDHIGALLEFVERYSDRVTVENFVHNLPGYGLYKGKNTAEKQPDEEAANLFDKSTLYYTLIRNFYPDSNIVVAHAGQRFTYGDIDVDVLFTTENLFKKQMYDTNMSSVLYSVTGKSGRMIILGDAQDIQCPILNEIYRDELKCDLVQVAHHGYNGGHAGMYASMAAKYAIWTNSYEVIMERSLHIPAKTPRNKFDYQSVEYNLIPFTSGDTILLWEGMAKADLVQYHVALTG